MYEIVDRMREELESARAFAIVTLIGESGSTPRARGAQMLVRGDSSIAGTIGGGLLEAAMIEEALRVIRSGRSALTGMSLAHGVADRDAMICGGSAEVLIVYVPPADPVMSEIAEALSAKGARSGARRWFCLSFDDAVGVTEASCCLMSEGEEPIGEAPCRSDELTRLVAKCEIHGSVELPSGRRLYVESLMPPCRAVICGGGHVGRALVPVARGVGFEVVILDDRPEFASRERFPSASRVLFLDSFADAFAEVVIDERSYLIIVTRGHAHDFEVLEQALCTPAGYIGLMSSSSKWRRFQAELAADGFTAADIARVHSPIGLSIGAETPPELAISIVGEMIAVRRGSGG